MVLLYIEFRSVRTGAYRWGVLDMYVNPNENQLMFDSWLPFNTRVAYTYGRYVYFTFCL